MKAIKIIAVCIILLGGCNIFSYSEAKIVFWKYDKDITFEQLNSYTYAEAKRNMEAAVEIPLDGINLYLWDEQILRMDTKEYANYGKKLSEIIEDSDPGEMFFSVVINNAILFNGLNRIKFITAEMKAYDDSTTIPRISVWGRNNNYILFRFSYSPTWTTASIWDMPESYGDVHLFFSEGLYDYYKDTGKIQRGRIDIKKFIKDERLRTFQVSPF